MSRLIAYVARIDGGIDVFEISEDGQSIVQIDGGVAPGYGRPSYLAYAKGTHTLYATDGNKDTGRNEAKPSSMAAYRVDPETAALTLINRKPVLSGMCCAVCTDPEEKYIYTASHGGFDCVIKVVETTDGKWVNTFVYDDSTVGQYPLAADGAIEDPCDCYVLTGHGMDPNRSPQAGGHAQASPHAHIVVVDPSGKFLLVCDKAGERIYVFRIGTDKLILNSVYQAPMQTGPRHCVFDQNGHVFMTCEFSSELWCFDFDAVNGVLTFNNKQSTLEPDFVGHNELATLQVTPDGKMVFANNRGEDTIVCFGVGEDGTLTKLSSTKAGNAGGNMRDATRDLMLMPNGKVLLVPVRPDDVLRAYAIGEDGSLTPIAEAPVPFPVKICLVEL